MGVFPHAFAKQVEVPCIAPDLTYSGAQTPSPLSALAPNATRSNMNAASRRAAIPVAVSLLLFLFIVILIGGTWLEPEHSIGTAMNRKSEYS
jgi:hypothetical protein